jgi:hypothetical protein
LEKRRCWWLQSRGTPLKWTLLTVIAAGPTDWGERYCPKKAKPAALAARKRIVWVSFMGASPSCSRSLPVLVAALLGGLHFAAGQSGGLENPLEAHSGFLIGLARLGRL